MKRQHLFGCALAVAACACGGNKTAPSPTVTTITVSSSSDLIFIGAAETFTATATLSDGTTTNVSAGAWGTTDPQIVAVEPSSGRVSGVGSGNATVFVDYQGQRGSRAIRSLPNYQGAWSGSYIVRTCTESGGIAAAGSCGSTFAVNRVLPIEIIATQTRDAGTAQLFLGTIAGSGTGPVQLSGEWLLAGTVRSGDLSIDTVWVLQSAVAGRMTGAGNLILRFAGLSGEVRIGVEIRDLNLASATASARATSGANPVRSLADLAAAIGNRH